jgi:hypothetical protein
MNLTEHFTLEELTFSQTAARHGIDNTPGDKALANLRGLANFLEVIRRIVGKPIIVTSGYRGPELNAVIGGSRTSAHMDGRAADIVSPSFGTPAELAERIAIEDIEFDQVILEFGRWVHVAVAENPRHQILTAVRGESGVEYKAGLV